MSSTTKHSRYFKKYKDRYRRNGCTKDQLWRLTDLGVLTKDEYKEITGDDYPESEDDVVE